MPGQREGNCTWPSYRQDMGKWQRFLANEVIADICSPGTTILKDINLNAAEGQKLVICGRTGR